MRNPKPAPNPHEESIFDLLKTLPQPEPSDALDASTRQQIEIKLKLENQAKLFENVIRQPDQYKIDTLPESLLKPVAMYHLAAREIASDPTLPPEIITQRQEYLLQSMREAISKPQHQQTSQPEQTQDPGMSV